MTGKYKCICIDIDGTITHPDFYVNEFNKYFNMNVDYESITDPYFEKYYVTEGQIENYYNNITDSVYSQPIIEEAKSIINKLADKTQIMFVTARKESELLNTLVWLLKQEVKFDTLVSKSVSDKWEFAKEVMCDLFIEDNGEGALLIAESGIKVILIDTPYNRAISHDNITRVKSWDEIREIILSK